MLPALILLALLNPAVTARFTPPEIPHSEVVRGDMGRDLDRFLSLLSDDGFSGAVLVAHGDQLVLKRGYGLADREKKIPNDSRTLFDIGPLAQIWTSGAVLHLADAGRLDLQDPISRYLGPFGDQRDEATVHQVLVHTAAMVPPGAQLETRSRQAFLESVRQADTGAAAPGREFRISPAGYSLLAALVEEVARVPFERYLDRAILQPAGLQSTGFAWDPRWRRRQRAVGYEGLGQNDLEPVPAVPEDWPQRGPGNVVTTVGDMYRWVLALRQGEILSAESVTGMFQAYVGTEGYAWHVIDESTRGRLVRRGGTVPGFESSLRWYRDSDLVIIFAINSNIGYRIRVARGIADILDRHLPLPEPASAP